jgi:hypothetical protein
VDKQHILDEIRRTAAENGGVPLGRKTFFNETGIKESDWSGKHWARWSDAVREAGLSPNKLKVAFDEDEIIQKFICFIRQLGRFPSVSELKMKRHRDPSFPTSKTFFTRFGLKNQLVQKIREYCHIHPGFEDVVQLCSGIPSPRVPTEGDGKVGVIGFVYLLRSGRYYKIGKSNAAGRRERELAIQLPEKAKAVHVIRTDDPTGIEAYWHDRFAAKRKHGEWFELDATDVKAFRRRKFM